MKLDPRERLIVALDVPSVAEAEALVARLGETVSFYKIGYQLAFAGGIDFARVLAGAGKRIFLDLKLHDIGNTVARGVEGVARLGASFLSVHAYPQTMHAAVDARKGSALRLLAVTVLTSYDESAFCQFRDHGNAFSRVQQRRWNWLSASGHVLDGLSSSTQNLCVVHSPHRQST